MISVLLGKTKIKTNKLHLATCYPNQSQLQSVFLSSVGVTRRHYSVCLVLLRFRSVRKALPGIRPLALQVNMPT